MTKIAYIEKRFEAASLKRISQADDIIEEYKGKGFQLTLRQLYYQFVARGLIPNSMRSYKNLGNVLNDGRMAGALDWESIEDRTRNLQSLTHWESPDHIIGAVARQFRLDKWENQPYRVEVWVEKDALAGVVEPACQDLDVPFFPCRGYTSQSEQWRAGMRFKGYAEKGQQILVIHMGDHDPSGIDMTRDNADRLRLFMGRLGGELEFRRVALNMSQVERYDPPPNPAKLTDSRIESYVALHGDESWELDALSPEVIDEIIRENVLGVRDDVIWDNDAEAERVHRENLQKVSDNWAAVETFVEDL